MYASALSSCTGHHMPNKAVPVAAASVARVYGNIIHIPIPMVAFMKRNNGESYQMSSAKQPDTLLRGPIPPRRREILLYGQLFSKKRLFPNIPDRLGVVGA